MLIAEYIIKFSAGLALVYLFYRFALRQLTFYQWNRFYLLLYTLACFLLPFINITPWMQQQQLADAHLSKTIPPIQWTTPTVERHDILSYVIFAVLILGIAAGAVRLIIQYISFRQMRKRSVLLHQRGNVRIFESQDSAGAFSFGNDIYINTSAHSHEELERILLHELVHVRQQHTIDLVIGEILCIVNWYNPFAWLIRNSIRQNLEYIADNNVLKKGCDRKEYQYLLLKITGVPAYRITPHFNIHDLKKRIIMMNKMKSAKLNLTRFAFALPLVAVMLFAFRNQVMDTPQVPLVFVDTVPPAIDEEQTPPEIVSEKEENEKGENDYSVGLMTTKKGTYVVIMKGNDKISTKLMTLSEWNRNKKENEKKYGKLPAPPEPPVPPVAPEAPVPPAPHPAKPAEPAPVPPVAPQPPAVEQIIKEQKHVMTLQKNAIAVQRNLEKKQQVLIEKQIELQKLQEKIEKQNRQAERLQQLLEEKVNKEEVEAD